MKRIRLISSLLSILLIGSTISVLAQQPDAEGDPSPGGMGRMDPNGMKMGNGRMMMMPGMMGRDCPMMGMARQGDAAPTYIDGRLAFLTTELGITDAQKDAWAAYSAALRKNMESMRSMRTDMMKSMGAKNPVDRLSAHILVMESRLNALREVKPALEHLYGALNADQSAKADELLTGMGCMM